MNCMQYTIRPGEINIDIKMVARVMGFDPGDIPDPFDELIRNELDLIATYDDIKGGYRIFRHAKPNLSAKTIAANGIVFNPGKQIMRFLQDAGMFAFFMCTAGETISNRIKERMNASLQVEAYVTDYIGSLLADAAMDVVHQHLAGDMKKQGLKVTNRYSPGYCNWNVDEQHKLFKLFPEGFCGIRISGSALMQPVKSVSGIIGIGTKVRFDKYVCNACSNVNCNYRNIKHSV